MEVTNEIKPTLSLKAGLIVFLSLFLIYSDSSLVVYSPSILLTTWTVIYFSPWLLKQIDILLLVFLHFLIIIFDNNHTMLELGKLIFMIGSFMLIMYFKEHFRFPHLLIAFFFLMELFLRMYEADFNIVGLYSIKPTGGLLQDSNFAGIFLSIIVASIIGRHYKAGKFSVSKINFYSIIFFSFMLILTFSRTGFVFLFFLLLSIYSVRLSIIALVVALITIIYQFSNSDSLLSIDGSLESKRVIFLGFIYLLNQGFDQILFGVGRDLAFDITINATNKNFAGHTIFGQIVEYGLLVNIIFYYIAFALVKRLYGNHYLFLFIPVLAIGISSLAPLSYMGLLWFMYYFSSKSFNSISSTKYLINRNFSKP